MYITHDSCIIKAKEPELTIVQESIPYFEGGIQRQDVGNSHSSLRFKRGSNAIQKL